MRARTQPGAACHRIIDDRQPPIFCHTDPKRPAESARRTVASRPRKDRRTVCKAVLRSRPGFRQLRFTPGMPYSNALHTAAAMLLPPLRPRATIYGTDETFRISSFASTTFTNPTGTPMMPAG